MSVLLVSSPGSWVAIVRVSAIAPSIPMPAPMHVMRSPVRSHEADDLIESGAEGHADADLDGALGNEARNHPVDPQRREEQPEDGETGPAGPEGHVPAGEPAAGTARTMNRCGAGPT